MGPGKRWMGGSHRRHEKVRRDEKLCVTFVQVHAPPVKFFLIDPAQHAWKSFASGPIFFYWRCIGFSGSPVLFAGKDMSQKSEVLFDRQHRGQRI